MESSNQDDSTVMLDLLQPATSHERQTSISQIDMESASLGADEGPSTGPSTGSTLFPIPYPTPHHQTRTAIKTDEGSGETKRTDSSLGSMLRRPAAIKRQYSGHPDLHNDHKRVCTGVDTVNRDLHDLMSDLDEIYKAAKRHSTKEAQRDIAFDLDQAIDEICSTMGYDWLKDSTYEDSLSSYGDFAVRRSRASPLTAGPRVDSDCRPAVESQDSFLGDYAYTQDHQKPASSYDDQGLQTRPSDDSNTPSSTSTKIISHHRADTQCVPDSNARLQSTIAVEPSELSSVGSLFGRPHVSGYSRSCATQSSISRPGPSVKSMHSGGMAGPMLEKPDEELLLSRAGHTAGFSEYAHSFESAQSRLEAECRHAAAHGDWPKLRLLITDLEYDCNHRDLEGRTPLIWATEQGYHEAIEALLEEHRSDLDANSRDNRGMTAIMFACRRGNLRPVDALLKLPAIDLSVQKNAGPSALMIAIQYGRTSLVRRLVSYIQTRPDYDTTSAKWHPLLNAPDASGMTPLHWAFKARNDGCIWTLLDTGRIDVDRKAFKGTTAAMQAVEDRMDPPTLEFLLKRQGCDPTVTNDRGETLVGVAERVAGDFQRAHEYFRSYGFQLDSAVLEASWGRLRICEAYAWDAEAERKRN